MALFILSELMTENDVSILLKCFLQLICAGVPWQKKIGEEYQMEKAFDLDLEVVHTKAKDVEPDFTSVSFCTPGCGETGSFNSFCC